MWATGIYAAFGVFFVSDAIKNPYNRGPAILVACICFALAWAAQLIKP